MFVYFPFRCIAAASLLFLYSLIFYEGISRIEICLFFSLCCPRPFLIFCQIGKISVRLIGPVDLCHMHCIAVGQELPIDTLPADYINILRCVVLHSLQCLFHAVYHLGTPHFPSRICGKNDIFPSVKRLGQGKSLQRLSSVYKALPMVSCRNIVWSAGMLTRSCPLFLIAQLLSNDTIAFIFTSLCRSLCAVP
nr:Dihydrofolate reductase SA-6 [uncultured bacterium]